MKFGRPRKRPIQTKIPRAPGVSNRGLTRPLDFLRENLHQFLRRNHFQLRIRAGSGALVGAPPSELRHVAKPVALHVLVGDFNHQFGTEWLPGEILSLAPSAFATRQALARFIRIRIRPVTPRVIGQKPFER